MNKFYKIPTNTKKRIYTDTGEKCNLPPYAIEKDWWVVQTLTLLFKLEISEYLVFKGGTSLSKSWNLIQRFSEDIDLSVDRKFFGFEGDLGKSQRTKLRKISNKYITETLCPELITTFNSRGIFDVVIKLEEIKTSDQDPVIINLFYPGIIDTPDYILPKVQIEIGCRSLQEPKANKDIISWVDHIHNNKPFSQESIKIPSVLPEKTFLEKIFLLHEEFQRPTEKIRVERLSRHLYDIYQISGSEFANNALSNKNLYKTIVKHRQRFTKLGGVDYNLHQPQSISFIPPYEYFNKWKEDYVTMQEHMIYGDSPSFNDLIEALNELNDKINSIEWNIDI